MHTICLTLLVTKDKSNVDFSFFLKQSNETYQSHRMYVCVGKSRIPMIHGLNNFLARMSTCYVYPMNNENVSKIKS